MPKGVYPKDKKHVMHRLLDGTVTAKNGCWLWKGATNEKGYGRIAMGVGLPSEKVHRLSAFFFLEYGVDSPLQVNHRLGCPNRNCWNPDHLYLGTTQQNSRDMVILGNQRNQYSYAD